MRLDTMRNRLRLAGSLGAGMVGLLATTDAQAHFRLMYPPQWVQEQDDLGDPQKAGPCGVDSSASYTVTNAMTTFAPGQTITLQWSETVAHDGWFRIAISYKNRTDLLDPPYAVNGIGFSTDAGIESPPVAPVLIDGLFEHTAASITTPKQYTYDLKLPTTPCDKCTLQVIQVMLNHPLNTPGGYTYHHCADISIQEGGDGGTVVTSDAGPTVVPADPDAATEPGGTGEGTSSGGTGGSTTGAGSSSGTGGGSSGTSGGGSNSTSVDADKSGGGCAASGGETTAAAGLGLLAGGIVAGTRRRRRGASSQPAATPPRPRA
jgi:MYXO-CTERM domain-containing protein